MAMSSVRCQLHILVEVPGRRLERGAQRRVRARDRSKRENSPCVESEGRCLSLQPVNVALLPNTPRGPHPLAA